MVTVTLAYSILVPLKTFFASDPMWPDLDFQLGSTTTNPNPLQPQPTQPSLFGGTDIPKYWRKFIWSDEHKRNECPRKNWDWSSYWFQCSKSIYRWHDQHGKYRPLFVRKHGCSYQYNLTFRRWINDEHKCSNTEKNVVIWEHWNANSFIRWCNIVHES